MKQLEKWRNDLHQIPEFGMQEYKTTKYLINELKQMGYNPQQVLETGCYVYIDNGKEKTIALRSDIDGLPIVEKSDHPYSSTHSNMMHACGHDGHMSMLLGLAKAIKDKSYNYNILLIFQPAEETTGGARLIVESGLLEQHNVKAIFGFHLMPSIDEGVIALKGGPLMAQCGELDVYIEGKGSHAGTPHEGVDALMIATQLINMYPTIITKTISPLENCLIHIGCMQAGQTNNSVANKAEFHGTVRAYSEQTFHHIADSIKTMNQQMETIYGCKITTSCEPLYPPVINDYSLTGQLASFLEVKQLHEPLMLAEDFSFYQKAVPGVFLFLGTKSDKYQSPLHADSFNFNNDLLQNGVDAYLRILENIKL